MKKINFILLSCIIFILTIVFALSDNHEVITNDQIAYDLIYEAQQNLQGLNFNNLPSDQVQDLISSSSVAYTLGDYSLSIQQAQEAIDLSLEIKELSDEMKFIKPVINSYSDYYLDFSLEEIMISAENQFLISAFDNTRQELDRINNIIKKNLSQTYDNLDKDRPTMLLILENTTFDNTKINSYFSNLKSSINSGEYDDSFSFLSEFNYLNLSVILISRLGQYRIIMIRSGMNTSRFDDGVNEARIHFNNLDFEFAFLSLNQSEASFLLSNDAKRRINEAESKIDEIENKGVDMTQQRTLLESAKLEFSRENFEGAISDAIEAKQSAEDALQQQLLIGTRTMSEIRQGIFSFILENIIKIMIIIPIITILSIFSTKLGRIKFYENKRKKLDEELETLDVLRKEAQWDYYDRKLIDKKNYELTLEEHEDRILTINNFIPILDDKIKSKKDFLKKYFKLDIDKILKKEIKETKDKP